LVTDPLYIGIDFGTSGCRSCVIDATATVQAEVAIPLPEPVDQQQDPATWRDALDANFDRLMRRLPPGRVAAIAVDGTSSTLLLCDAGGAPLGPALMYNNTAATTAAQQIAKIAPANCAAHGPTASLAKLLTLQADPANRDARFALHQADWITGRLCGRYGITDENNALKLGFDPVTRVWPNWLDRLGVHRDLLPEVVPPGQAVGSLAPMLAERWDLDESTRIVSGTTDSTAGFIATGAGPGEAVTALGSTLVLKVCSDRPVFAPDHGVYSHRLGDHWLAGGASNSGGTVLRRYFSDRQIQQLSLAVHPESPTGLDYYPLPATGERFPENNPQLAPRLEPRPIDDAIFFQGLLEGITAIEQRGYRLLESLGAPWPERIYTVGGGAINEAWRVMRETALGIPVEVALHQQAAYGAALLARQGLTGKSSATEDTEKKNDQYFFTD
jgi:sugar (pentulose or hexulose) kinase